jgi:two-component system, NarL family, response regulator LiaR
VGASVENAEAGRIQVVIVDDHDLYRAGLTAMLNEGPGVEVVGQASRGRMGVRLIAELGPQVVLMDLTMPDLDGISATGEILALSPETRVIVVAPVATDAEVEAAVLAGACGFLLKDAPVSEVIAAIQAAASGDSWLAPRAAKAVLEKLRRDHVEPREADHAVDTLSARELEVLRLVARGLENAQIAEQLFISPRTAKNHLSNVLAKLGMSNRVQAAIYAVRHGLE